MTQMSTRLKAPSILYAKDIVKSGDPKEIYIAINEFAYHISKQSKNVVSACYWLEWLLEFEIISKKKRAPCICERRTFAPIQDKYQHDVIWIIWDILLYECGKQGDSAKGKIMNAILDIFSIKYTPGVKKRRRYLIYFAIALLTEPFEINTNIINNKEIIENIIKKIDIVYRDVKKNEITPDTDYLFDGTAATETKSNLEKTIERLEKLNKLSGFT